MSFISRKVPYRSRFLLSTPPNAITNSTGIIQQKDMMKVGIIMGAIGLAFGIGWMLLVF